MTETVLTGLHSEASFTHVDQPVQKAAIDMFGVHRQKSQVISDINFIGQLHNFNFPLIKNSWKDASTDYLKLPMPQFG